MKKLCILIFLATSIVCGFTQNNTVDQFIITTSTSYLGGSSSSSGKYNGEFMIRLGGSYFSHMYGWLCLSYKVETVSFPFMPDCYTNTPYGCCNNSTTTRNFIIPDEANYGDMTSPSFSGKGWSNNLFHYNDIIRFSTYYINPMESENMALASAAYVSCAPFSPSSELHFPHTPLKITVYLHRGTNITDEIMDEISYIFDPTRGRLKDYPFHDKNESCSIFDLASYDFLVVPTLEYDPSGHTYNETTNANWYTTTNGTINYFPHIATSPFNSYGIANYPDPSNYYLDFDNWIYTHPAPYCLQNLVYSNNDGSSYVGFDNQGAIDPGITHTYNVDKSFDLSIINPGEKVIYNPSEVNIDIDASYANREITFPYGYTFKTINGIYPDKSVIINATSGYYLYKDIRDVPFSNSDIGSPHDHQSTYTIKNGSKLTIEPCATIIDADIVVESGATLDYNSTYTKLINSSISGAGTINSNVSFPNHDCDCRFECYNLENYTDDAIEIGITESTTWSSSNLYTLFNIQQGDPLKISGGITITANNTLTIEEGVRLEFSPTGYIKINPGAKLIVNGSDAEPVVFTSACNNMWEGIQVIGDESIGQGTISNPLQSYVELNYCTIEHARTAILVGSFDGVYYDDTKTGGIVNASNCDFLNNGRTLHFEPYTYKINNVIAANQSRFESCNFKTLEILKDYKTFPDGIGDCQVYLKGVKGVKFYDCEFETSSSLGLEPHLRGTGIYCHNASFLFSTISNITPQPNTFRGFSEGIWVANGCTGEHITIDNHVFEGNIHAIVLDGVTYAYIFNNDITIPLSEETGYATTSTERGYDKPVGLYLNECRVFKAEENTFTIETPYTTSVAADYYTFGVVVNSTTKGGDGTNVYNDGYGRIYKNTFDGMSVAIQTEGNNKGGNINPSSFHDDLGTGVAFDCNSFETYVIDVNTTDVLRNQGICSIKPAKNEFSTNANNDMHLELTNIDPTNIIYLYNSLINYVPLTSKVHNEFINYSVLITCPTGSPTNECPSYQGIMPAFEDVYTVHAQKSAYVASAKATISSTIDNGNTQDALDFIEGNLDDEIFNYLTDISPYLSDEVLLALINKEPAFTVDFLFDIIIQNSPLSQSLLDVVLEYEPLENYIENILSAQTGVSARSELFHELDYYTFEENMALADLLFVAFEEDNETNMDLCRDILLTNTSLEGYYRLFHFYMRNGEYTEASTVLEDISANFSEEDETYRYRLCQIGLSTAQDNYNYMNMSSSDFEALGNMIESYPSEAFNAKAIVYEMTGERYLHWPYQEEIDEKRAIPGQSLEKISDEIQLKVYPNPAKNYVKIETEDLSDQDYVIRIFDIMGKTIYYKYFPGTKSNIIIDTRSYNKGIYIVELSLEEKRLQKKLLISY